MCSTEVPGSRLRRVLPFEAEPSGLRVLRRVVRDQLADWGLPALSGEVQLAVTELATNVIKHVGAGVAATLVMEPGQGTLRVEIHDTSHVVPAVTEARCGDECGRGLHLLAHMSVDWGTVITATGKAVWCELATGVATQCVGIQRAAAAVESYRSIAADLAPLTAMRLPVLEDAATGLIADLLHWLNVQGADSDEILDRAQTRFEADGP